MSTTSYYRQGLRQLIAILSTLTFLKIVDPWINFQPVIAQSSTNCQAAQRLAVQRLTNGRDLKVSEVNLSRSQHTDHPSGRHQEYVIQMHGNALESIFNSPQLLKGITIDILNACPQIGRVRYARAGSGEAYSVGLLNDGRIDFFTCAEEEGIYPGHGQGNQPLRWGLEFCSI